MGRRKPNNYKRNQNNNGSNRKPNSTTGSNEERNLKATNQQESGENSNTDSDSGKDAGGVKSTSINDPEWYKKFPELAFGAANLPFSERLGSPINFGDIRTGIMQNDTEYIYDDGRAKNDAVPGICSIRVKPSYGMNWDLNSPLNVAANQLYTNVRYINSGRKNYDPADLTIAELAVAELYSYINWMERIYGYAYMYSMRNNYINGLLISANHVNVTDITEKLANFRYWINTFISRVSVFAVPAEINIFRRRAFMYAHLYTESITGNIKDQLYQFVPDGFYRFQLDGTGKGMLKYVAMKQFADTKWTLNNIEAFGEHLLANIANDEDFGLISGDIIKAFGSNLLKLEACPEALVIIPEYEEFTLSQMRNARIAPVSRGTAARSYKLKGNNDETFTSGDVMQANNGNIVTCEIMHDDDPDVNIANIIALLPGIITVTNPNPGIDDVLEATRLITCGVFTEDVPFNVDLKHNILYSGSDIVTEWVMSQWIYNSEGTLFQPLEETVNKQIVDLTSTVGYNRRRFDCVHFHWAPMLYLVDFTDEVDNEIYFKFIDILSNIDNYTTLSTTNVKNLHEVSLISLLSVPGVARLVG